MEIHVVGAGGIGCALGYALRASGREVLFVDADRHKIDWGRRHGVVVAGKPPLPAKFIHFSDWAPRCGAIVLLCTKCYDNAAVLARLPDDAELIPVQNGFDPALQARRHALEGIASFVSECVPGQTHTCITRPGDLHLGPTGPGALETLESLPWLARSLRRGLFRVRVVADILPFKNTKLIYNAAISPLAAAAGIDNATLLSLPAARQLFFALLRENYGILRSAGAPLGKVGPLRPRWVALILSRPWLANLLARAFEPSLRGTYCSMSGDLPRGRTEMDNYNGHLVRLAGDKPCPLNRRVLTLVVRMVREGIAPHPAVLEELRLLQGERLA